jgi:predicted nucleotidyltransferase
MLPLVGEEDFADYVASTLEGLPGVLAVALGGSRATGTHRPDSDWDFAVYYRGRFDPDDLRGPARDVSASSASCSTWPGSRPTSWSPSWP